VLDHQNNYVKILSIDNNAAKVLTFQFERPTLQYFDDANKIIFRSS